MTTNDNQLKNLISAWQDFNFQKEFLILEGDELLLDKKFKDKICSYKNYSEFISNKNFGFLNENLLHLSLPPVPYSGNLNSAKIFLLMLNPGFSEIDYFSNNMQECISLQKRNLNQEIKPNDFPMINLNPKNLWDGGGQYWKKKFEDLIKIISQKKNLSYVDTLRFFSKKIAVLQLLPYHSCKFGISEKIFSELKSVNLMKNFVKNYLVPKSENGDVCIIATRANKYWELNESENIIIYRGSKSRGAYLTSKTEGGKKILEFLTRD